jgi:cysteinyl-tRNA synthetase
MDEDFNAADGLAALFTFVNRVNGELDRQGVVTPADREAALESLRSIDRVLGLIEVAQASRTVDAGLATWVEERIEARAEARRAKDFATADAVRDELAERGIVLEDGADGTRWKVVG